MEAKASLNYLRISPRKMRLVADLIRGKKVAEAEKLLDFSIKKGARPFKKLLDSAKANAKNNFNLDEDSLTISSVMVDEGPKLKRWRARSKGRAFAIQKKTSHLNIIVEGQNIDAKQIKKEQPTEMISKAKDEPQKEEKENKAIGKTVKVRRQERPREKKSKAGALSKRMFRRKAMS